MSENRGDGVGDGEHLYPGCGDSGNYKSSYYEGGEDAGDEMPAISLPESLPKTKRRAYVCNYGGESLFQKASSTDKEEKSVLGEEIVDSLSENASETPRKSVIYSLPPIVSMSELKTSGAIKYSSPSSLMEEISSFRKSLGSAPWHADPGRCDEIQTFAMDQPDEERFTTDELRSLCLRLREQKRILQLLMKQAESTGQYPQESAPPRDLRPDQDQPCHFLPADEGSAFQFNEEILMCTDLLVMIMKSGVSYQSEDYRFRFKKTNTVMDLKMETSSKLKKKYYLIQVLSVEDKEFSDPVPFTCILSSENDIVPSYIKLVILPDVQLEEAEPTKYNVYLIPDVVKTRVFVGNYSGILRFVTLPKFDGHPFLGGYKDRVICKDFHNASTQTCMVDCKIYEKFQENRFKEKWTQIHQMKHACVQTPVDTSTQMTHVNVYRSSFLDKVTVPSGTYQTSIEYWLNIMNFVVTVQKYVRRWYARRVVERRLATRLCIVRAEKEQLDFSFITKEREEHMLRRYNPKTKDDFDLLYVDLEAWRLEETAKIVSTMKGAERKASLARLLDDEANLIKCIGGKMKDIKDERLNLILQHFIDKVSKPKLKRDSKGFPLSIDHWYKVESRHLHSIYKTLEFSTRFLKHPYERMSVLANVKKYLQKPYPEVITDLKLELTKLIDREAVLMMKGVKNNKLMGLRKRINHLFHLLLKKPEFNPAVAHYNETLHGREYLKTITHCNSCNRGLPVSYFPDSIQTSFSPRTCKECQRTYNRACKRADNSPYQSMLLKLRKDERDYDDGARLAFFMQVKDVRYLVNCIWHMKSIISKNSDLSSLVLIRWEVHREWSPWNCMLITMHEALLHTRSIDINKTYSDELLFSIHLKHNQGRHDFSKLLKLVVKMPTHKKLVLPSLMSCSEWARRATGGKKATKKKAILCEKITLLK